MLSEEQKQNIKDFILGKTDVCTEKLTSESMDYAKSVVELEKLQLGLKLTLKKKE